MKKKNGKLIAVGLIPGVILFFIAGLIFPPSISEERINEALAFCKENNLNTDYAVFVDFGKHSGRERYMIYSFSQHKVVYRCLCTGLSIDEYSNRQNCNLSYLGKYRIQKWSHKILVGKGERILADGLEITYSNAKNKVILIYDSRLLDVFPKSLFPIPIIGEGNSHGCFSITAKGVEKTKKLPKPTLLWTYK